jgi:hypothetical protein
MDKSGVKVKCIMITGVVALVLLAGCVGNPAIPNSTPTQSPTLTGPPTTPGISFATYTDAATGWSIQYPADWDYALSDVMASDNTTLLLTNAYFKPYNSDRILLAVSVQEPILREGQTIDMMAEEQLNSVTGGNATVTVLENSNITVSSYPARKLEYIVSDQNMTALDQFVFVATPDHTYILISELLGDQVALYKPTVDHMISSFHISV